MTIQSCSGKSGMLLEMPSLVLTGEGQNFTW